METKAIFLVKTPMIEGDIINSEKVENRAWNRGQCVWFLMPHAAPDTGPLLPWKFPSSLAWPGLCRADSVLLGMVRLIGSVIVVSVLSFIILVNREKSAHLGVQQLNSIKLKLI